MVRVEFSSEPPEFSYKLVRRDLARYAGAAGDFHFLHTDDAKAQKAGFPGVFAHGMLSAGLLATAVTGWAGVGALLRYRVRFVAPAWPDRQYHSEISVVRERDEHGNAVVDFECSLRDDAGEAVVIGSGTVRRNAAEGLAS